jgi:vancomycin resistance protein VanJ
MPLPRRPVVWIAAAALAVPLAAWAFLYFGADELPGATLLAFGPRWIVGLPLVVVLPLAVRVRSYWAVGLVVAAAIVVAGPVAGGQVGVGRWFEADRPALQQLRVVTWNAGGAKAGPSLRRFVDATGPSLLFCQESQLAEGDLPPGWKVLGEGGNKIATRLPARADGSLELWRLGAGGRLDRFVLQTPDGDVVLVNLHLPTPRPGIEAAIGSKFRDLGELRRMIEIRAEASRVALSWVGSPDAPLILAGDFNMPAESRIYRASWSGFRNAFSEVGIGWGTTKQTRWYGTRIDHVLYTPPWKCRRAWVGPSMGSDHRPVVADLALEAD